MRQKMISFIIMTFSVMFLLFNHSFEILAEPLETLTGNCGKDGDNVTWVLSDSDGNETYDRLVISGNGDMADYDYYSTQPWAVENEGFYNDKITEVIIEEGVTSVGNFAFGGYQAVESVSIPSTVTMIHSCAFNNCLKLTEINLPEGLTEIENGAFAYTGLRKIDIPENVTVIGPQAFCGTFLTRITIPDKVTELGYECFWGCNLTEINLPESLTKIGEGVFRYCSMESIVIPENVTVIGSGAFEDCDKLEAVILPENGNLDVSGADIPENCAEIRYETVGDTLVITNAELNEAGSSVKIPEIFGEKTITIPGNLSGRLTFASNEPDIVTKGICGDNLVWELGTDGTLSISGTGDMYNYFIYGNPAPWDRYKTKVTKVEMKEGITYIGEDAFNGCDALETIVIPPQVSSIGTSVFDGCTSLETLVIPENISIDNMVPESASQVKYKTDEKGDIKITEITGNNVVSVPSKIGGIPVVFVPEEYRDKVSSDSHFHSYTNYICVICGMVDPNHQHRGGMASCVTPAVCEICKEEYGGLLEHIWNEGKITKKAGCTKTGIITYTCTVCQIMRNEEIAITNHSFTEGICSICGMVDPNHQHRGGMASCAAPAVCEICKEEYGGLLEHTWNEGKITKEADCTKTGILTYTCTVCQTTRNEEIAITNHSFTEGICSVCGAADPDYSVQIEDDIEADDEEVLSVMDSVKTCDESNVLLYIVLALLSAGYMLFCFSKSVFTKDFL